jgi:integrase
LLGLRWADLDWDRAEITISQQVQGISEVEQTPDGPVTHYKNVISPSPKTKAGRRTIPVPPGLIERLRAHWRQQQEERRYLGVKWHEHGLIFASEVGTPVMPRNFESTWYRLRERAGIGADRNFHIFRHTCATLMGAAGVLEEVRAAILGHSKRTMTQYYTHAVDDAKRGAVEVVERRLIEAVEEKRRKEKAG